MENPLVSIIIPTFNRALIIGKALDSVLAQSYAHWECIVIDDGSTDHTFEILKRYQERDFRIQFCERQREPKGAPTCRNIGLAKAKGDFIIFLDSDDYLLPFCLEQRVIQYKQYPNHNFLVFPMAENRDGTIAKKSIPDYEDYLIPFLSSNLPWQTMCPIWKKEFLIKLNGFTEGYHRFNDPELMIRALLQKDISYKVFYERNYDSIHIIADKQTKDFVAKVYKSLRLFIPDTVNNLKMANCLELKTYLANYLHLWFKYIYVPIPNRGFLKSIKLIWIFKKYDVISFFKAMGLVMRLLLYSITKIMPIKTIDKISSKAIYIN